MRCAEHGATLFQTEGAIGHAASPSPHGPSPHSPSPQRADLDPAEIVPLLPGIVLIDVVADARCFIYRLVGTREVAMRGRDPTGKSVGEGLYGASAEASMASYQDVVARRAPRLKRREFTTPDGRYGREQVILLPLSDDDARVTMIFAYSHHMLR